MTNITRYRYFFVHSTFYLRGILPSKITQFFPLLPLIMILVSLIVKNYPNFLFHLMAESPLIWFGDLSSGIFNIDTTSYNSICFIYPYYDYYTYDNVLKYDPVRDLSPDREVFEPKRGPSNNNNNNNNNNHNQDFTTDSNRRRSNSDEREPNSNEREPNPNNDESFDKRTINIPQDADYVTQMESLLKQLKEAKANSNRLTLNTLGYKTNPEFQALIKRMKGDNHNLLRHKGIGATQVNRVLFDKIDEIIEKAKNS